MDKKTALRGVATLSLWAGDLEAASAWYSEVFGLEPYFRREGYVEFRVGDRRTEVGLIDRKYAPAGHSGELGGALVYWHVDDLAATVDRLTALGARLLQPVQERGAGFVTATLIDPFGNLLGVMFNPHYLEMSEA